MKPDNLIDFLLANPVENTPADEFKNTKSCETTPKLTQEQIAAMNESILDDSIKLIRYFESQKAKQEKFNRKTTIIGLLAMIFSAIAAIGTIVGILL